MDSWLTYLPPLLGTLLLASFIPLTAATYFRYRRGQRCNEVNRILALLEVDASVRRIYSIGVSGRYYFLAVAFATALSLGGLATLFLGHQIGMAEQRSLLLGGARFAGEKALDSCTLPAPLLQYQQGALLAFGMAFLGAYLWGLQNLLRRHSRNDLAPSAYYNVAVRMIFAAMLALLLYHTADAFGGLEITVAGEGEEGVGDRSMSLLPVLAFLIGMFPQRGLRWLKKRFTLFASEPDPWVRELPLNMIEGLSLYDRIRFNEQGIDDCHDLANADFVPYLLKTPYTARELIDWILQAKLCVYFGEAVGELRRHGVRLITDLERLEKDDFELLIKESAVPESSLRRARALVEEDDDIARLKGAAQHLGRYWKQGKPGREGPPVVVDGDVDPCAAPPEETASPAPDDQASA